MRKKAISKLTAFISVVLCLSAVFNSNAVAVNSQPNSTVESISVYNQSGVIEGETIQLRVSIESSGSVFNSVKWSSSNPQVISCTEDGKIKGLVAGESATITCKAKWGSANDSIRVYCVEKLPDEVNSGFKEILTFVNSDPGWGLKDICFNSKKFFGLFLDIFRVFAALQSNTSSDVYTGSKVLVCGRIKNYAYIRYGESNSQDGFVKYTRLEKTIDGFLNLSAADMDVWANGVSYDNRKLTTTYDGDVEWIVGNKDYITYNETTGQIAGLAEGAGKTATITAKADGMTDTCTIHLLYKWPQAWTTKTNKDTYLYKAEGEEYKTTKALLSGKEFVVQGDCGTNNGWAYGYYQVGETKHWGYIPIADVSTKGTISQYNLMNFRWPVYDVNIKKISSPFGPRSTANGGNHKGFDIVSDNAGDIEGKPVVASYNGTITRIYVDNNKETSHGNAIVITTDKIDPISGKNLTVIYMHLSRWDTNSSGNIVVNGKVLKEGGSVTKEQIIGYAGNTGYNTSGAHLHYEVNNQNAAIRSGSNNPFTETINPIYFYMSMDNSITKSNTCEAASNGNGFYWYGENG